MPAHPLVILYELSFVCLESNSSFLLNKTLIFFWEVTALLLLWSRALLSPGLDVGT